MNLTQKKIGVFGGTFNPIHYGHLRAAEEARETIGLDHILFIPSGNPPLKVTGLAPAADRFEMTRLAIKGNPLFLISDIECKRQGKSYTVETLLELKRLYADNSLYLILGIDSFLEIPAWREPERLIEITNFIVISRPGYKFSSLHERIDVSASSLAKLDNNELQICRSESHSNREIFLLSLTRLDISASAIRRRAEQGLSIKYLLPDTVESYIISNKLYSQEGVIDFRKQG